MKNYIYPLTIIRDRYSGCYSGGKFTAWNIDADCIPYAQCGSDIPCGSFWGENTRPVGLGDTPDEAIKDLETKLGAS